jgi:tetratricopeptide (TPR) repeat protein
MGVVAVMEHDLGLVALNSQDYARARRHFEESLRVSRDIGFEEYEPGVLASIGYLELEESNVAGANQWFKEGLQLALERNAIDEGIAHDLYILCRVMVLRGDVESACVLVGACDAAFDLVGLVRERPAEVARNEVLRRAEAAIGPDALAKARERGETLTIVEAVRYALSVD